MKLRLAAGSAAVLVLLAGCGDDGSGDGDATANGSPTEATSESPTDEPGADGTPLAADQPWLVRLEIGTDEVASGVSYVRVTPSTGATQVTNLRLDPPAFEPNEWLQVDAGREWAIRANESTLRQEDHGEVTIYSLTGKAKQLVDLRQVTGAADLKPLGFAFDPEEAGLLRVLATDGRLFEYDVPSGTATAAGKVEPKRGFDLAPHFDSATGMPLQREAATWEYEEGGTYQAGGITPIQADLGACPDPASPHSTIEDSTGTTWDACLDGRQVKIFRKAEEQAEWELVGTSEAKVPTDPMTMTWVLPPLA
jgi:hypothetical protein